MNNDILKNIKKIHFIGIGGSGMCPLANILHNKGYIVSGSDNYMSDTLERIIDRGFDVHIGHDEKNIGDAELIVYSAAIKQDNPEILAAKKLNIPIMERSDLLGLVCSQYENLVAVAGTHGKTTTTAMLTQILTVGRADPTAVIGGKLPFIGGNSRIGNSQNIVCEACEYVDTFLKLTPNIAVILNVEADHLDYFKNLEGVVNSFKKFACKATELVVLNGDDKNSVEAAKNANVPVITFGLGENNNYRAEKIVEKYGVCEEFAVVKDGEHLGTFSLKVPGKYNLYNAMAAIAVADYMKIDIEKIKEAISEFSGVHRRFEILSKKNGITIADDFAHHPTEIENTLNAAKKMGYNRVICIFQPHTYSRTSLFLDDFAKALSIADIAIVSEILAVREVNTYNIYATDLVEKIDGGVYRKTFEDIVNYIEEIAKPGDLILTMGGGNVYECANMLARRNNDKSE